MHGALSVRPLGRPVQRELPLEMCSLSARQRPVSPDFRKAMTINTACADCLYLRTTTLQKCAAVPRRDRIQCA